MSSTTSEVSALPHGGWQHRKKRDAIRSRDKMQPSLLDRLTDNAPQAREEPASANIISHSALRRSVLRDLQWLFNTVNNEQHLELSELPNVQRSVLNFGLPPLAGRRMSDIEWQDIQSKISATILHFEPRIMPQGLQIRCICDTNSLTLHNILSIEIQGHLWCVPWPLEFLFRTDVDLENGSVELRDSE